MDALDKMIGEKRDEVDSLRERIRVLEAELSALQLAAELRPAPTSKRATKHSRSGGGRRPGDISMDWRNILKEAFRRGGRVSYDEIGAIAAGLGNELAPSSIRDRVRNMIKTGLMSGNPQDGFTVTVEAAERFGFADENGGSAEPPDEETGSAGGAPGFYQLPTGLPGA